MANANGCDVGAGGKGVSFDHSGKVVGFGGEKGVGVWAVKPWGKIAVFEGVKKEVTGVGFTTATKGVVAGSMDKTVKFYGVE